MVEELERYVRIKHDLDRLLDQFSDQAMQTLDDRVAASGVFDLSRCTITPKTEDEFVEIFNATLFHK